MTLKKGDRVRLNPKTVTWNVVHPERIGTVVSRKNSDHVRILWDGRKSTEWYNNMFIEKVDDGVHNLV